MFRVLLARLINTSFSFNGAGASPQPSKVPFIWVIYGSSSRSTRGMADPVHISVWWSTPGLGKINRAIREKINKWWALPLPNSPESLLRQSERRWGSRKRDFNMNFAPFNGGPGYFFSQFHPCSFILFSHAPFPIFLLLCHCVTLPTVIVNTAIMDCERLNYSLHRALGELWQNVVADKNASSSAPLQWWRVPMRVDQREPFPWGPPSRRTN